MLDDIFKELLEGILYECVYDGKARHNKQLNKAREQMTSAEKTACTVIYYTTGTSYLALLVVVPLCFALQGSLLLEVWAWGFLLHFLLSELMILLARRIKNSPQSSLRQLLFIRHRIRHFWMHTARWLPLVFSLILLIYLHL